MGWPIMGLPVNERFVSESKSRVLVRDQILLLFCQDVSSPLSHIRALLNSIRAHCHEDKAIVELSQVIIVSQSLIVVEWPLYVVIVAQ